MDSPKAIDPHKHPHSIEYLMKRSDWTANDFGFGDRCCAVYNNGKCYFGMSERQLARLLNKADLLINISGHLPKNSPLMRVPCRAYIDVEPGFTQMWMGHHPPQVGPLLRPMKRHSERVIMRLATEQGRLIDAIVVTRSKGDSDAH